ncbi:hypothetical protein MGYG_08599 [Nannizzia gypsea CBS 118893]|uniref:Uncharacterized protein n=1 Tax=Arthroderma gypseum (strain ATCC MYA-4604 / CBS 118893) TaxID=535722 RepID=E4V6G0_ARTGP|nr:hypothetical protein MGYG_08599 [Nannizzia gypsea CBS 118893]EFQ96676.1 hypothetical protein MGYG_08599 [Nannizzia gypsea CBS 118893]
MNINGSNITIEEDDGRAKIVAYSAENKFMPGDEVYYTDPTTKVREGPYLVSSTPSLKKYKLCHKNGQLVKEGMPIEEKDLKLADDDL